MSEPARRPWRRLFTGALAATVLGGLMLAAATALSLRPMPERLPPGATVQKPQVLDRHGAALNITYQNHWNSHDWVPLAEIPLTLQRAFLAAEDRRFYAHGGADWLARGHAMWQNLKALEVVRGASTISEQSVRMLHPRPRTFWARWLEGWEAAALEARYSKADILEFYLNQVPYAGRRRGVAQAARHYFNRDLDTLDAREMIALAVLVRSPSRLDLYRGGDALRTRLHQVAEAMIARGWLEPRVLAELDRPFDLQPPTLVAQADDWVREVWAEAEQQALQGPFLRTTLDAELQRGAHDLLQEVRQGLAAQDVQNAAALVVDHQTGEVLAWINAHAAGAGHAFDAVTVPRQPGSTLKPFVYELAMERGWTAATVIDDDPLREAVGQGQHAYRNYSRSHYGPLRLRVALANSLNIPAVRAAQFVGPEQLLQRLRALGFDSLRQHPDVYGDGLALGNGEVSLLELVRAYATLANGGRYRELRRLRDLPELGQREVLDRRAAQIIGHILADPEARSLEFGVGGLMRFPRQTAIKTGTSSDYRDAWAVAFDHRYVVGVWMGNLDGTPMREITGARGPVPAVRAIFQLLNRYDPGRPLPLGDDLVRQAVCRDTGLPADGTCPAIDEWFIAGTVPTAAPVAAEPIPRLRQPSWDLQLAMDPRIPDARERFLFELVDVPADATVQWLVDREPVAETVEPRWAWTLQRGEHRVQARVRLANGSDVLTRETPFRVR